MFKSYGEDKKKEEFVSDFSIFVKNHSDLLKRWGVFILNLARTIFCRFSKMSDFAQIFFILAPQQVRL